MLTRKKDTENRWMRRIERMDRKQLEREFKKISTQNIPYRVVLFLVERMSHFNSPK